MKISTNKIKIISKNDQLPLSVKFEVVLSIANSKIYFKLIYHSDKQQTFLR
jgi:hypothetical protein